MGLNICAYGRLTFVKPATYESLKASGWSDPLLDLSTYTLIAVADECFRYRLGGMLEGFYRVDPEHEFEFRAGSYSGYSAWRRKLAEIVGTTAKAVWNGDDQGPFRELIGFSDSEGSIGTEVCAKLARDFDEWADRLPTDRDFRFLYGDFRRAFHLAAQDGAVRFH
jgi:hypothetical protein